MTIILDGKKLSEKILEDLKKEVEKKQLKLKLAVVLVGDDRASRIFVKRKEIACQKVGIGFKLYKFDKNISNQKLKNEVEKIVKNPENKGVVVQLPLPKRIAIQEVLNIIPPEKDIDVLSEKARAKFYSGNLPVLPPVVEAVSALLKEYNIKIKGRNVTVVGAGKLVGLPVNLWALNMGAAVSVVTEKTKNAPRFLRKADIIISGVGKANLIKGNMVKRGAVVIDAGTSSERGKTFGDVDFKSVSKKASYITPVPGGVGPLTVACLIENLVKLNSK